MTISGEAKCKVTRQAYEERPPSTESYGNFWKSDLDRNSQIPSNYRTTAITYEANYQQLPCPNLAIIHRNNVIQS